MSSGRGVRTAEDYDWVGPALQPLAEGLTFESSFQPDEPQVGGTPNIGMHPNGYQRASHDRVAATG